MSEKGMPRVHQGWCAVYLLQRLDALCVFHILRFSNTCWWCRPDKESSMCLSVK